MSPRRAVRLSVVWLVLGLLAGVAVLAVAGRDRAVDYWAVYLIERSLSLDNVFVFLLILDAFAIPRPMRRRVVWWGIVFALAVRVVAIALGAELIERFEAIEYALGALLLVFAARMLREGPGSFDATNSRAMRVIRRAVPVTDETRSGRFIDRAGGRRAVTPLGLALVALVVADITFAVDSIPAAFAITTNAPVIWAANLMALLGLLPLLVLVRSLIQRFRFMPQTLAAVLAFIGIRLVLKDVVTLGPVAGLLGVLAILGVGVLASVAASRREDLSAK